MKRQDQTPVTVLLACLWAVGLSSGLGAQSLQISAGDVHLEAREDGYHLFVKATPGLGSILLAESFELPDHRLSTYALRSTEPTALGKDQKRLLDGKFLKQPHNSLMSSTPGVGPQGESVFEVLIPPVVEFGSQANPNTRWGRVNVREQLSSAAGFWFSIRAFAKPYADYAGSYRDNAFELKTFLVQAPSPSGDKYEKGLVEGFSRLGESYKANDIQDALARIVRALDKTGQSLDMVLAIDTTKSMAVNLKVVKDNLLGPVGEEVKKFKTVRIGLVFYRDYMENYLTKVVGFQNDLTLVQKELDKAVAEGGGDIPEAVVEALAAGVSQFAWKAENRVVLLLGDAPQHPAPRGSVTEAELQRMAADRGVELQLILLPQTAF
jgi:hypothetical protein